jgi:hypothetical protein
MARKARDDCGVWLWRAESTPLLNDENTQSRLRNRMTEGTPLEFTITSM